MSDSEDSMWGDLEAHAQVSIRILGEKKKKIKHGGRILINFDTKPRFSDFSFVFHFFKNCILAFLFVKHVE